MRKVIRCHTSVRTPRPHLNCKCGYSAAACDGVNTNRPAAQYFFGRPVATTKQTAGKVTHSKTGGGDQSVSSPCPLPAQPSPGHPRRTCHNCGARPSQLRRATACVRHRHRLTSYRQPSRSRCRAPRLLLRWRRRSPVTVARPPRRWTTSHRRRRRRAAATVGRSGRVNRERLRRHRRDIGSTTTSYTNTHTDTHRKREREREREREHRQ